MQMMTIEKEHEGEKYIAVDGSKPVQLRALRNISDKEELVYDYGKKRLPWSKKNSRETFYWLKIQNKTFQKAVTTCASTVCDDHRINKTDFSQDFQYLKIQDSDVEDALSLTLTNTIEGYP